MGNQQVVGDIAPLAWLQVLALLREQVVLLRSARQGEVQAVHD